MELDLCAWCHEPLTGEPYRSYGLTFCSEVCAGKSEDLARGFKENDPPYDEASNLGEESDDEDEVQG